MRFSFDDPNKILYVCIFLNNKTCSLQILKIENMHNIYNYTLQIKHNCLRLIHQPENYKHYTNALAIYLFKFYLYIIQNIFFSSFPMHIIDMTIWLYIQWFNLNHLQMQNIALIKGKHTIYWWSHSKLAENSFTQLAKISDLIWLNLVNEKKNIFKTAGRFRLTWKAIEG